MDFVWRPSKDEAWPPPRKCLEVFLGHSGKMVNIQKAIENGHRNSGFSHEKWVDFP